MDDISLDSDTLHDWLEKKKAESALKAFEKFLDKDVLATQIEAYIDSKKLLRLCGTGQIIKSLTDKDHMSLAVSIGIKHGFLYVMGHLFDDYVRLEKFEKARNLYIAALVGRTETTNLIDFRLYLEKSLKSKHCHNLEHFLFLFPENGTFNHDEEKFFNIFFANITEHGIATSGGIIKELYDKACECGLDKKELVRKIHSISAEPHFTKQILFFGLETEPLILYLALKNSGEQLLKNAAQKSLSEQQWIDFFSEYINYLTCEDLQKLEQFFGAQIFETIYTSLENGTADTEMEKRIEKLRNLSEANDRMKIIKQDPDFADDYDVTILTIKKMSYAVGATLLTTDAANRIMTLYHFKLGLVVNIIIQSKDKMVCQAHLLSQNLSPNDIESFKQDYQSLDKTKADLILEQEKNGHHIIKEELAFPLSGSLKKISVIYQMQGQQIILDFGNIATPIIIPMAALDHDAQIFLAKIRTHFGIAPAIEAPKTRILSLSPPVPRPDGL